MELNQLYEALEKKAINNARSRMKTARNNFKATLTHPNGGTYRNLEVKTSTKINNETIEVCIDVDTFFSDLEKQLISEQKECLISNEIHRFMSNQESYAKQVNSMQKYLEE